MPIRLHSPPSFVDQQKLGTRRGESIGDVSWLGRGSWSSPTRLSDFAGTRVNIANAPPVVTAPSSICRLK